MTQETPTLGKITPYPFQWEVAQNAIEHVRQQLTGKIKNTPAYINAYVSAGKTILGGIIANHCYARKVNLLILARTGELVEQNAEEIFNMGSACSIYSASLGRKSTHYSTVVGTEGTIANALGTDFSEWVPHIILIDECHQVNWEDYLKDGTSDYSKILRHFKQLNPNVCIVGMTGSPYRGIESIKGPFWGKEITPTIGRKFLVENEYIMPTEFGHVADDIKYDLSEFDQMQEEGTKDFSSAQVEMMHDKMSFSNTQAIMSEIRVIMQDRLCALVTCAGLKHCQEAASTVPDDEFAIITDKTGKKDRQQILRDAKKGLLNDRGTFRYKYIFQVGCLTTGVNIPLWCTSVILRRIGSLTLLTQLLGRGMRLLKPEHVEAGFDKNNHLVLDYSGTMAAMHQMFDDPLLEDAAMTADKENGNFITCPICETINGEHARRCRGPADNEEGRCDHFWKSRKCEDKMRGGIVIRKGCGADNDIAARQCRKCGEYLIDPNDALINKSYGVGDWKPVEKMTLEVIGKNKDGVQVNYYLDNHDEHGNQEVAKVKYWSIQAGGQRTWLSNFVNRHVNGYSFQHQVKQMTPFAIVKKNKSIFDCPMEVTHRVNEKGQSIVHGLKFRSGKTMRGSKRVNE